MGPWTYAIKVFWRVFYRVSSKNLTEYKFEIYIIIL